MSIVGYDPCASNARHSDEPVGRRLANPETVLCVGPLGSNVREALEQYVMRADERFGEQCGSLAVQGGLLTACTRKRLVEHQ
jgi:hypothetical protein